MNRPAVSLLIVTALAAASVLPSPYATLWPDTVRDISVSLALVRGESIPLAGPPINFGPHIGPAWFWLLAPALAFFPSMVAASVWVAVLASLKFHGLYFLGRALSGDRLGLCLAVAAALPSVAAFQWIVFFQLNVVEAAIAATLLLLALAQGARSVRGVYAAAAVLGLAIQMHPTSLFYYPAVVLMLARLEVRRWRLAMHVAGTLAMMALWFTPLLFVAGIDQQAGMQSGMSRVATGLQEFAPADILTVLRTAYVDVPMAIGETYAAQAGVPLRLWRACLILAVLAGACGFVATLRERRRRWMAAAALAGLLAGWTIATAMRTYTSFYLGYFLLPLSALVLGVGLERVVTSESRAVRIVGHVAMSVIALCFVASAIGAFKVGGEVHVESRLPGLADLKHPAKGRVSANLMTAAARDALARRACATPGSITLYGDLAYALAASTSLDLRLHCPGRETDVAILGPPSAGAAWTALAAMQAAALGKAPAARLQGLAIFDVKQVLHPPRRRAIESDWHFFERLRDRKPLTRVTLAFRAGPRDAVIVYRLKPFDSRWQLLRLERDGQPAAAALSTFNSTIYLSSDTGSEWRIDFETDAPDWVDVHVF